LRATIANLEPIESSLGGFGRKVGAPPPGIPEGRPTFQKRGAGAGGPYFFFSLCPAPMILRRVHPRSRPLPKIGPVLMGLMQVRWPRGAFSVFAAPRPRDGRRRQSDASGKKNGTRPSIFPPDRNRGQGLAAGVSGRMAAVSFLPTKAPLALWGGRNSGTGGRHENQRRLFQVPKTLLKHNWLGPPRSRCRKRLGGGGSLFFGIGTRRKAICGKRFWQG